ncbi:hypothetical protein LAZ67_5001409 [Cordylochernes scorpioides]|uniref:Integrase catalytic domain-containing protein n=1 Tax=Cordylochernes scorpioides TaxID=51811 RepID=A0ABY6KFL0_9ARAC|nr:hypothetical protein LAZ67_5001409 [Cordylochernes scorpioides]
MSIKIHFLHSHLDKFPDNLGAYSDEQGERFHQGMKVMEERYQAKFLVEDYIYKHGAPREMIKDHGRYFISQVIKEINALCANGHRVTLAYPPQTYYLIERFNKTLGEMLSMCTGVEKKD